MISARSIGELAVAEENNQRGVITLIASENYPSPDAIKAVSSYLVMKMAVGYPGRRVSTGCESSDEIETLAKACAQELFNANHANVQCTSGAQANYAVYLASLGIGDSVISAPLHVGDPSQGGAGSVSARDYRFFRYEIDDASGEINYAGLLDVAKKQRPKLITAGASSYPRAYDFTKFRAICDEVGALFHVDAAHLAGLIVAKVHAPAFPLADYMTFSSQKTMRGPRGGGGALCRHGLSGRLDAAVSPGIQSSPVMSGVAALAVILCEAREQSFTRYQQQVLKNAKTLAQSLQKAGFILAYGGTDTHMLVIDLRRTGVCGEEAMDRLSKIGILSSRARLSFDVSHRPSSGLRLGAGAATTRGLREKDMEVLAGYIARALDGDETKLRKEVRDFAASFPMFQAAA